MSFLALLLLLKFLNMAELKLCNADTIIRLKIKLSNKLLHAFERESNQICLTHFVL